MLTKANKTVYFPIFEKKILEIHIIKKLTSDICRVFKSRQGGKSVFLLNLLECVILFTEEN